MSKRLVPAAVTVLLLAIMVGGCETTPTGSEPLMGQYGLASVDGRPLPAVLFEGLVEMEEEGPAELLRIDVVGGSMALRRGEVYEQEVFVRAYVGGLLVSTSRWTDRGRVTRQGDSLRFASTLIQNVAFDGAMRGGGIELDEDLLRHYHDAGALSSFRFERFGATSQ